MKKPKSSEELVRIAELIAAQTQVINSLNTLCKVLNVQSFAPLKETKATATPVRVVGNNISTQPEVHTNSRKRNLRQDNSESLPDEQLFEKVPKHLAFRGKRRPATIAADSASETHNAAYGSGNRFAALPNHPAGIQFEFQRNPSPSPFP